MTCSVHAGWRAQLEPGAIGARWHAWWDLAIVLKIQVNEHTVCYAIVLPGRKSDFRAGFRPDSCRGSLKISWRAGFAALPFKNPAEIRPGSPISRLHNIGLSMSGSFRSSVSFDLEAFGQFRSPILEVETAKLDASGFKAATRLSYLAV